MAVALEPIHVTATIGADASTWPSDWPSFAPGNISGGASLGGGISAFQTLSAHHSIIVQFIENYSAVGNNPGSLRPGPFADRHGTTGSENGFAVFPTFADGMMATADLLDGDSYNSLTVNEAIAKWAPPGENDTAGYQAFIRDNMVRSDQYVTYVPGYTKPSDYGSVTIMNLTDSQFTALVFGIFVKEGRMTITQPPPGGGG
jgi:hypothetical protein